MHARLEELISLRDRQPVDAATASHVVACAQCSGEITTERRPVGALKRRRCRVLRRRTCGH